MFTIAALEADHIPKILEANGGAWWRRDGAYWIKCLEEQARGRRAAAVASDADGIVGYGYLNWSSQYHRFRALDIPEISDLRVAERRRRSGVATAMIGHFCEAARQAGCEVIGIGVGMYRGYGAAQRLYVKLGFMPDGNGLTYGSEDVEPGAMVTVDDSLVLWFVRDLPPATPALSPAERPA